MAGADGRREADHGTRAGVGRVRDDGPVLYSEAGWGWAWILAAPLFCLAAGLFEWATGAPVHWLMLLVCALGSGFCHGVMIAATRVHGKVRLTGETYTQGTEELAIADIAGVLPAPAVPVGRFGGAELPEWAWERARLLGELRDVPRRRHAVGLRLTSGAEVRAYARDADALRAALTSVAGVADYPDDASGSDAGTVDPWDAR